MKKLFYIGIAGLTLFEVFNVYFIMPMPGSQRMNSLDLAYFLYSYRWYFRILFVLLIAIGATKTFRDTQRKWIPALFLLPPLASIFFFNFKLSADAMFKQPETLTFASKEKNTLGDSTVVVAVNNNGEVKGYPIRFIVYHHQVQDNVGGKPLIITYCSVCRTGRVYEPSVKGTHEKFRLVGMDHFNAMFEDATTKSWWRQATGEAVTGKLKGETLPEVESFQIRLDKLFELYPNALVMQIDKASKTHYDSLGKFERGKSKGDLTRTDSLSWNDKSWVVGIQIGNASKAYDWNQLKRVRIINDQFGGKSIVLAIADDNQTFVSFERASDTTVFAIKRDTLSASAQRYNFAGKEIGNEGKILVPVKAYQEFWHSWRTFHPNTQRFQN